MPDTRPKSAVAGRLLSLDAFRGATIAAMILVNNPGDWGHVYWPLLHVPWHGWTPTDLIFPFFLFMVGMSLTFSRRTGARPAVSRALKLVGLGLLMALYPYFPFLTVRWPGVLQRIGLCYLAAWAAKRWLRPRGQAVLAASLLLGYWALMTKVDRPRGPRAEPRDADEPLRAGGPHPARASRLERDEDLGPRGGALHLPRDRDHGPGPARRGVGPLRAQAVRDDAGPAARRPRAHRPRPPLGRGGAPLASVPDQQEHLDVVLRPVHRRPGRGAVRPHLLGRGRGRLEALGHAVRDLRQERDRRVRGVRPSRQDAPLHQVAGRLRRGGEPVAAPLPGALRELAPALRGLVCVGAVDGPRLLPRGPGMDRRGIYLKV